MTHKVPYELPVPDFSRIRMKKTKDAAHVSHPLHQSSFLGLGKKKELPSQQAAIKKNKKELDKIDAELARVEQAIKNVEN